jgi:hypothetical protein
MIAQYIASSIEQTRWGGNDDPRGFLIPGKFYEVLEQEVHSWHTKLILTQFPDKKFNSVCFTLYDDLKQKPRRI